MQDDPIPSKIEDLSWIKDAYLNTTSFPSYSGLRDSDNTFENSEMGQKLGKIYECCLSACHIKIVITLRAENSLPPTGLQNRSIQEKSLGLTITGL